HRSSFFVLLGRPPPRPTLFPYTTLFRSLGHDPALLRRGAGGSKAVGGVPVDLRSRPYHARRSARLTGACRFAAWRGAVRGRGLRSEEHTSELQSRSDLVCRLLLEKKKRP